MIACHIRELTIKGALPTCVFPACEILTQVDETMKGLSVSLPREQWPMLTSYTCSVRSLRGIDTDIKDLRVYMHGEHDFDGLVNADIVTHARYICVMESDEARLPRLRGINGLTWTLQWDKLSLPTYFQRLQEVKFHLEDHAIVPLETLAAGCPVLRALGLSCTPSFRGLHTPFQSLTRISWFCARPCSSTYALHAYVPPRVDGDLDLLFPSLPYFTVSCSVVLFVYIR